MMNWVSRLLRKFLPKDIFADYQTVIIPNNKRNDVHKYFSAGPGNFEFEFIARQENIFVVKIGLASGKDGRFKGTPTDTKYIDGSKDEGVFRITLSGNDFQYQKNDMWLLRIRAQTFAPYRKDNALDIYVSEP